MATATAENPQQVATTWDANEVPTDDQKIEFTDQVLTQLSDVDTVRVFQNNVKQVGVWANEIDTEFDKVMRTFVGLEKDFPTFAAYNREWVGYEARWGALLSLSRYVAAEDAALLRRFDKVFLDMVESIETDQDRKDVIIELQQFIEEKHDRSERLSKGFLLLKQDIEDFVERLGQFIEHQGINILPEATKLKGLLDTLQSEITALNEKIKDATVALVATGACLCIIGVVVAGGFLASYQKERNDKAAELAIKQAELAEVNRRQQQASANLIGYFAGLTPDFVLFCEKQALFGQIWSSVKSEAKQIQEHLKGGMGGLTNIRFKREVRLVRAMCAPLQAGLENYATELENRKRS